MSKLGMKVTKIVEVEVPDLVEKIKTARTFDHRTLTEICRRAGMTTANWYRIESGAQSIPIETLQKIEKALGVDFGVRFD
jgi:transcriptional regulator with XRE-family HTH domain